jgi:hypothetical protein
VKIAENISRIFVKVINEKRLGLVDKDEEVQAIADLTYWWIQPSKTMLAMTDEMFNMVKILDPTLGLRSSEFSIDLAKGGKPNNFVTFCP